ncbi:MAG: phasin family protein [Actinomycetota bacterium]
MRDEIRRVALITSGVVELTRNRAEAVVRDLIKSGDLSGGQASQAVRDLMERSRQNRSEILNLVRSEIRGQIEGVGVATKRDIERLERRIARLEGNAPAASTTGRRPQKTAKKTAKKSTRKTAKRTGKKTTRRAPDGG